MKSDLIINTISISVQAASLSTAAAFIPALFLAWKIIRNPSLFNKSLELIFSIPLVIPPVTTGYLLLLIFSPVGLAGSFLAETFNIRLAFSFYAVIIAQTAVAFPLILRSLRASLQMVDNALYEQALMSGSPPFKSFLQIILPIAAPGIISGLILGFARCMGEFGATITFAGNLPGVTSTLPMAIYTQLEIPGREQIAFQLAAISIIISFSAILISEALNSKMSKKKEFYNGPRH